MRFTLGKMFLAIGMLALACAGLMYRNMLWCELIFTASVLLFVSQVIIGIATRSIERVRRVAFAVTGVAYLCAVLWVTTSQLVLTNRVLSFVWLRLYEASPGLRDPADYLYYYLEGKIELWRLNPMGLNLLSFFLIGHCVFSWLFAVLAAWFAGRMYDRRERASKEAT